MPLNPEHNSFGPAEIDVLVRALKDALQVLAISQDDPAATLVAKIIIELAEHGEGDPVRLRDETVRQARERLRRLPGLFGSRASLADPRRH